MFNKFPEYSKYFTFLKYYTENIDLLFEINGDQNTNIRKMKNILDTTEEDKFLLVIHTYILYVVLSITFDNST